MTCLIAAAMIGTMAGKAGAEIYLTSSFARTDLNRFVAFRLEDGRPVVIDTFADDYHLIRHSKNCIPTDIDRGLVLLACPAPSEDPQVDLFSHRLASVTNGGSRSFLPPKPFILANLGLYRASGRFDTCGVSPHCTGPVFVDRKTRQIRYFGEGSDPVPYPGAVDRPGLFSPPPPPPYDFGGDANAIVYNERYLVTDDGYRTWLWRPDERPRTIARTLGYCCSPYPPDPRDPILGRDQFTWSVTGRVFRSVELDSLRRHQVILRTQGAVEPISGGLVLSYNYRRNQPRSDNRAFVSIRRYPG